MSNNWNMLKESIKKNIKRPFEDIKRFDFTFEEGLDLFYSVLTYELNLNDLDDRTDIIRALESRYIQRDLNNLGLVLNTLVMKIEPMLKRIYFINNGTSQEATFASCLKYFFRDFSYLNKNEIDEFFAKDNNKQPIYEPDHFRNMMPFGNHLKLAYDVRNKIGHLDPDLDEETQLLYIKSIVIVYLFITFSYYDKLHSKVGSNKIPTNSNTNWNEFNTACNHFDDNYHYFLITGPSLNLSPEQLQHFANINWSLIFDFDIESDTNGLLTSVRPQLERNKAIRHIINTKENIQIDFPMNTTFWYSASGVKGIKDSLLQSTSIFEWKEKYSDFTKNIVRDFYKSSPIKPVTVIILLDEKKLVEEVIHSIKSIFGGSTNFVFATQDNINFIDIIRDSAINAHNCSINHTEIAEGFRELQGTILSTILDDKIYLPCNPTKGKSIGLELKDAQLVRQYFEILHLNISSEKNAETSDNKNFYQGRVITWAELDYGNVDIKREITDEIETDVREWLDNRSYGIVNLFHDPGAGGTTIGRRIAINIYNKYPTLVLKNYDKVKTAEEMHRIFSLTGQPIFVLVDDATIKLNQIRELMKTCEDKLTKTTFLVIKRTYDYLRDNNNSRKNKDNFVHYLPLTLHKKEQSRFLYQFKEKFPLKTDIYNEIESNGNSKELTPFYFGLITYEKEYLSLSDYVKNRIENCTAMQREVLVLIAFSSYYGTDKFKELPAIIFNKVLNLNENYVILQNHIDNNKLFDLIIESDNLHWRTLHFLIAEEVLYQLIGGNGKKQIDPSNLVEWAIKFIYAIKDSMYSKNEEGLSILSSIFIERNGNSEEQYDSFDIKHYNPKVFSKLITDAYINENRISILKHLVEAFPDEPHFWGHLARLYSYNKHLPDAINSIDKGIRLLDNLDRKKDFFILYHIKGMCYRAEAYLIKEQYFGDKLIPEQEFKRFVDLFYLAEEQFEQTRKLAPNKDYGYVSSIQFICQAIDFGFSISNFKKEDGYTQFLTDISSSWYREILTIANELLNTAKENNDGETSNKYIKDQENNILKLYDNHDKLIQSWRLLIDNTDHDPFFVRRQVVNAYFAKYKFNLHEIDNKTLKKVEDLLLENIKNSPVDKDIKNWFEVARRLGKSIEDIITTLQHREFFKETLESSYYLYSLNIVKSLLGSKISIDYAVEYMTKCKERITTHKSKVFCKEWIGMKNGKYILINNRDVGEWKKELSFFEQDRPEKLARLKGRVVKIDGPNQGFIELDSSGIKVLYVPGKESHYSSNLHDPVEFFLGFSYHGPRAFKVRPLAKP
jgi:hypothetical protein